MLVEAIGHVKGSNNNYLLQDVDNIISINEVPMEQNKHLNEKLSRQISVLKILKESKLKECREASMEEGQMAEASMEEEQFPKALNEEKKMPEVSMEEIQMHWYHSFSCSDRPTKD